MYKKTVLDNGLKVVTHRMPGMQSVALGIWVKVGGRYETEEKKGISHYMEHLAFKGSSRYSCRKIKETIEGVGGALNGFTSEELTCYLVKLPSRHLDLALDILSSMTVSPLLSIDDIAKERTVILEEIKMYKDSPQSYVYELLDNLLWPKQPLGTSIAGSADSVGRIQKKDLVRFKEQYYVPANIVVSAAGLLEHSRFVEKTRKVFLNQKETACGKFLAAEEKQLKPQMELFHKETEQTHLALGFHGFKKEHKLRFALGLLHVVLGANMSSRLFNEVREKRGLAYEIGTQIKFFQDTGAFVVHAGIDNQKVKKAISVILAELARTREQLISPDEFRRAKEFYLGQVVLTLEDTLDHMLWIGESMATVDKTYTTEEVIREVNKVRREDIRLAARQIFRDERLNLAVIGPLQNIRDAIYKDLRFC